MKIIKLKSKHPKTPYALTYDVSIGITSWNDNDVDVVRDFLLSIEEEILEHEISSTGGTGLDSGAVTTRHGRYNVFDYIPQCPALGKLLSFIQKEYLQFIKLDNTQKFQVSMGCWFNILRSGNEMLEHRHSTLEKGYLSGNMHFADGTITQYRHFDQRLSVPNMRGGLTFFPSYVAHSVDVWTSDKPRVSLAFDLYMTKTKDTVGPAIIRFIQ